MMDQDAKLIRMANQIAGYFKAYPEDQAKTGIHDHIKAFWTPKMRQRLNSQIGDGVEGIHPLVAAAMRETSGAPSPAAKEAAGPAEVGEIDASDAG